MTSQGQAPLASEWNDEKNASIDWTDVEDVSGNCFTFLQILMAHPRLDAFFDQHRDEKDFYKAMFLSWEHRSEQAEALKKWNEQQLLSLRTARWCRHCGFEGHTRARCAQRTKKADPQEVDEAGKDVGTQATGTSDKARDTFVLSQPAPSSKVMEKYRAHQQHLARLKLLGEKTKRLESKAGKGDSSLVSANRTRNGNNNSGYNQRQYNSPHVKDKNTEASLFTEERRHGTISRLDVSNGIGFLRMQDASEAKFFLDNTGYGVKSIAVGDSVYFRMDESRGFPVASDVHPEKPVITEADVVKFITRCKTHKQPIVLITMLLMHRHEWNEVLVWIRSLADREAFADAVHTLVELITFIENREPIHLNMLEAFLSLTIEDHSGSAQTSTTVAVPPRQTEAAEAKVGGGKAFFLDMVQDALEWNDELTRTIGCNTGATTSPPSGTNKGGNDQIEHPGHGKDSEAAEMRLLRCSERWIEVVNYLILLRQYTNVASARLERVQQSLFHLLEMRMAASPRPANYSQLENARHRLQSSTAADRGSAMFIPSAKEFSVPPPLPQSPFFPANLPINGVGLYSSQEEFIRAQCQLLRADTFEATSRLMPSLCYQLPDYEPSKETKSDMEHARLFGKVRFLAKVITDDRDFGHPDSYILEVQPMSAKANLSAQLLQGATVCITTSLNRTEIEDTEVFWGTVSSGNSRLLNVNAIVVMPCEFSTPFTVLQENLLRNETAGRDDCSLLMETPIFMSGYMSIMKALRAFLGPLAMPLPMAQQIIQTKPKEAVTAASRRGRLLSHIPLHCEYAFQELIVDVRGRFILDAGQDTLMQELPYSKVLLVQGPPGTGKSFIGCRVVETYVRYKQLLASGDILQRVDVDLLTSTRLDALLPVMGPIVVITYKNHALDEFLVDMLNCGLWNEGRPQTGQQLASVAALDGPRGVAGVTSSVGSPDMFPGGRRLVRIGGRSKEPRLDPHNLGSLLHSMSDKSAIKSLRERIFVLQQRIERLTKEIHYLEKGKVPKTYFLRWLTPEQQQHITFEEREEWLRGERYIGEPLNRPKVDPKLYLEILSTKLGAALEAGNVQKGLGDESKREQHNSELISGPAVVLQKDGDAETEDVSLSVFQEMKRENESRELNSALDGNYLSREAINLANNPPARPEEVPAEFMSFWSLDPVTRHKYYAYLIQRTISVKAKTCLALMNTLLNVVQIRNHAIDEAKLSLLRGADVVGVTTTGCAMNQNLIRSLRPSVLVVEEAAEVLEMQLLACMTDSLKQIILIGDHFQLQPKVETFMYEKVNRLNLSLFERLATHISPIRLTEQRRMHPDIATLIRPFYDPQPLIDHPLVLQRPFVMASGALLYNGVPGLVERVFFWRHDHPEEEPPGSRSKINTREIRMVQQVAQLLVSEGVLQGSITVITPYLGQCRVLRSVLRLSSLPKVRVSTVDLFQGDENDIIILSMTRTEKLTEFIRMRNRLIVSCSRARFAMVIIGNDTLLKQCEHWAQVLKYLEEKKCVGTKLPVRYRDRPGKVVWMEAAGTISAEKLTKEIEASLASVTPAEAESDVKEKENQSSIHSIIPG
ncbi:unnamed protein product [Phytomonas sp. EM1]|nr:unnamed protein product [Phytomonas sp. EM1]|eukprot:CCW59709.1 unnamed protein product [Phytomonas sp. isolate EM1]